MRHMPAAMVHAGGGALFMMTTKFAPQETIKKNKTTKQMQSKPPPSQPYPTQNNNTKSQAKTNHPNKHPALSNTLTVEMQYFQMRKMHQR